MRKLPGLCAAALAPFAFLASVPVTADAAPSLPDLTVPLGGEITFSKDPGGQGRSVKWAQTLNLSDADASETGNGACTFNVRYQITNLGKAEAKPPYLVGLYAEGGGKAESQGVPLAPAETKEIRARLALKPGSQLVTLHINQQSAALPPIQELNVANNGGSLKVNLSGTCQAAKPAGKVDRP